MDAQTKKHKNSRQRDCIYQALQATTAHPTAEELWLAVRQKMPTVSLATVYRNLKLLVAEGCAITISMGDRERFDATVATHAHMRCKVCGGVTDVALSAQQAASLQAIAEGEFSLMFHAVCKNCKKNIK